MKQVKFSVIVPIYKVEKYLDKCIESILNQTYSDFELILVDDGSPDNCPQMCDDYAKKDNRIKVIHKKNGGLVSARNAAIQVATGEYVCYVDGDDWISEKLLETVYDKAIEKYSPDMVIFNIVKQYENEQQLIPNDLKEGLYDKEQLEKQIYPYMMYNPQKSFCKGLVFPAACNKIYRTRILKEHFCSDERIRMGEDNAFVFECLYYSDKLYVCTDTLYYYNQLNEGSITSRYDANRFINNQYLTTYIETKLGGINPQMDSQINAFKAYWLIMAIFHEVKCKQKLSKSRKHIKENIKKTGVLKGITLKGLPITAKVYLIMLKCHFYYMSLFAAKILAKNRT